MAEINKLHEDYAKDFENKKYDKILNEIGIKTTVLDNGMLELDQFSQPKNFTFEELGLDENELFKHIEKISGDAGFHDSKVTDLGNLQSIGGYAFFIGSKMLDLGQLSSIGGDADFTNSKMLDLGQLSSIGGDADFSNSNVIDLNNLKHIGGDAYFRDSKITDLGNLKSIGRDAYFKNSKITNLGNLKFIGGKAIFDNAYIVAGNVEHIGGNIYSNHEVVEDKSKLMFLKQPD